MKRKCVCPRCGGQLELVRTYEYEERSMMNDDGSLGRVVSSGDAVETESMYLVCKNCSKRLYHEYDFIFNYVNEEIELLD